MPQTSPSEVAGIKWNFVFQNNLSGKDYKREMLVDSDDGSYNVRDIIEKERTMKYGSAVVVKQNYSALAECIEKNDIQGMAKTLNLFTTTFQAQLIQQAGFPRGIFRKFTTKTHCEQNNVNTICTI
jgi:hypothetical protein